jgi:hypothetical protein
MSFKRVLITWFDIHGIRHQASRHVTYKRLVAEFEEKLSWELNQ